RNCFFFQAEGGIRCWSVTGVQTCALPISRLRQSPCPAAGSPAPAAARPVAGGSPAPRPWQPAAPHAAPPAAGPGGSARAAPRPSPGPPPSKGPCGSAPPPAGPSWTGAAAQTLWGCRPASPVGPIASPLDAGITTAQKESDVPVVSGQPGLDFSVVQIRRRARSYRSGAFAFQVLLMKGTYGWHSCASQRDLVMSPGPGDALPVGPPRPGQVEPGASARRRAPLGLRRSALFAARSGRPAGAAGTDP